MLRLNLATRPFYNERLVTAAIAVVVLLTAALAAFNVIEILSLNSRNREVVTQTVAAESKAAELRSQALATRQAMVREQVAEVQEAASEANVLIDRRVFSWTDLFNRFEETLPADVRILAVAPQVDAQGRLLVAVSTVSRRQEDRDAFIERLLETGAFSGVIPRSEEALDDGTLRSVLQGYYTQTPRATEAVSSPPASDSNDAGDNKSPATAAPATPGARGLR